MSLISLPELGTSDWLIPLPVPNGKWRDSKVLFKFSVPVLGDTPFVDQVRFEAIRSGATIYEVTYTDRYLVAGKYTWFWDGYDSNDVLDTTQLNGKGLSIKLTLKKESQEVSHELNLDNEPETAEWVDLRVDLKGKCVDIKVYVNIENKDHLPSQEFERLKKLVFEGIHKHWSRDINVDGDSYKVNVTAGERSKKSVGIDIFKDASKFSVPWYHRSHNFGFIGQDVKLYYLSEFFQDPQWSDDDFACTAAHEFGHSILYAAVGIRISGTHKGTSTLLTQAVRKDAPYVPPTGEIDLMKYYRSDIMKGMYSRVVAAEEDVKRLIWIAGVDFDED